MTFGRTLWYVLVVFVMIIAIAAGIVSLSYIVAGQYSQFLVYCLLSMFCFTFFLSSEPWVRTRQLPSVSNAQSCPSCGYSNPSGSMYCMQCGVALQTSSMSAARVVCSSCHREIQIGWRFCHYCGNALGTDKGATTPPI